MTRKLLLAVALVATMIPLSGRAEAPPPSPTSRSTTAPRSRCASPTPTATSKGKSTRRSSRWRAYWRAGHELILQIHAPPANDPISTYMYEPNSPSVVEILQDADHPTSILLPFMPTPPPHRETAPACGSVVGEGCITPSLG